MPKVSVIVPGYNHARYLRRRMDSILAQTFADIEVIALDDCSSDESPKILREYAARDARVSVHVNARNSGSTFRQWNKGVCLATGEYAWIAESDDWADPAFLSRLVGILDDNPELGLVYANSHIVDADDRITGLEWHAEAFGIDNARWKRDFSNNGRDECQRFLLKCNTIPNASAVVFRRGLFANVGGANAHCRLVGDWLTWGKILMRGDIAYAADKLNYWRLHDNTVRSRTERHQLAAAEDCAARLLLLCYTRVEHSLWTAALRTFTNDLLQCSRRTDGSLTARVVFAGLRPLFERTFLLLKCISCVATSLVANAVAGPRGRAGDAHERSVFDNQGKEESNR